MSTSSSDSPASTTQRRTPSSTRSAMTPIGWRSTRIGRARVDSTLPQKSVTTKTMRLAAILAPTTRAASGFSSSITRGLPRAPSVRISPIWRVRISPSSSSDAVIADTVVVESCVLSLISTREIGPWRRMLSSTLSRLIARISSGSAVFMGSCCDQCRFENKFMSDCGLNNGVREGCVKPFAQKISMAP
ncbi:hypothetical protein D3C71_1476740 [compost metagenome]